MGIEIERRFLVENDDWKPKVILREDFNVMHAFLLSINLTRVAHSSMLEFK